MQDALLCYYIVANLLHAGYLADVMKLLRRVCAFCRSAFANAGSARTTMRPTTGAPVLLRDLDEWVARLTRMESYVESMA